MSEYNLMWIQIQIWIQLILSGFIWYWFRLDWIKGGVGPWWRYALIFNTDLTLCTVLRMYCRICSAHAEFLYLDLTLADPRAAICPPACQQRSYCWKHCPCCHQRVTALRGPVPPFNLPAVWRETVQFTKTQSWNTWFSVLCLWRVWEYDTHLLQNEFLIFCLLKKEKNKFPSFSSHSVVFRIIISNWKLWTHLIVIAFLFLPLSSVIWLQWFRFPTDHFSCHSFSKNSVTSI